MCRHLGYLGPTASLHDLLLAQKHSLEVQSYAPKEMESARLNADGFGVAWYAPSQEAPARYRSELPLWADANLPDFARQTTSGCVLANARSATPGVGMGLANTMPFVRGRLAFSHNGFLERFREGTMRAMREGLHDEAYELVRGGSDAEHLFATFADAQEGCEGDAVRAMQKVVARVREVAPERKALLSLLVSDGASLVAMRHARHGHAPSLYLLEEKAAWWVASEPLDERPWQPIESGQIVRIEGGRIETFEVDDE